MDKEIYDKLSQSDKDLYNKLDTVPVRLNDAKIAFRLENGDSIERDDIALYKGNMQEYVDKLIKLQGQYNEERHKIYMQGIKKSFEVKN